MTSHPLGQKGHCFFLVFLHITNPKFTTVCNAIVCFFFFLNMYSSQSDNLTILLTQKQLQVLQSQKANIVNFNH